jgi:hypothetical protein
MPRFDPRVTLATLALLATTGCVTINGDRGALMRPGETIHESVHIDLAKAKDAERVDVRLEMNAGELRVNGGAKELVESDFTYNVAGWKPEVRFERTGLRGELLIKQGGHSGSLGTAKNEWQVNLNESVPLDFTLQCGAGDNRLFLGGLDLRDVEVNLGAGRVELDLRGKQPTHDYSVRINGGVGEADVKLPADTEIVAEASGGLGGIDVHGLEKQDGEWRNSAPRSKATIHLEVHGGIGQIRIDAQ